MVKYLLDKFKAGTNLEDLGDKTAISEDHTLTWGSMYDYALTGIAQNAYQTLQANNVFENKDFLAADEFTDSNGTNNTVVTTDMYYNSSDDSYNLLFENTESYIFSGSTTLGQNSITTTGTIDDSVGYFSSISVRYESGSSNITTTIKKGSTTIATKTEATPSSDGVYTVSFDDTDYSDFLESGDSFSIIITSTANNMSVSSTNQTYSGTYFSFSSQPVPRVQSGDGSCINYQERNFATSGSIKVSNLTLDGTEKSECVYGDITLESNTSVLVDLSDGTTTLSDNNVNEVVGLDGFTSGTATQEFKFTGDGSNNAKIKGYGVFIR